MSSPNVIRLYDRSRTICDWQCPRKRYWQYEYAGTGIVPDGTPLELFMGTTIHDGLAAIALMHQHGAVDIDVIARTAFDQMYAELIADSDGFYEAEHFANEQATLVEGMLRGFHKCVWPKLLEAYPTILAIEQELLFRHDASGRGNVDGQFGFMSKPDLVLQNRDGEVAYIEYKSTSAKKDSWLSSWNTAVQLHSTLRAIEQTLNIKPSHVIVQGLYKGYESYGKQSSPFCYAYVRGANPPFTKGETSYEYRAGFKRSPTWQMEGGVAKWVDAMPDDVLADQFPCTPPIYINEALVDAFFAQRARREADIDTWHTFTETDSVDLDNQFPQRFDQCIPFFGKPCGYRNLCFGFVPDPLSQGYKEREPHHQPEVDQWSQTDSNAS